MNWFKQLLRRRSVDAYSANITLKQIIQRKTAYYENDHSEEFAAVNKGYVRGFNQMLADINMFTGGSKKKKAAIPESISFLTTKRCI